MIRFLVSDGMAHGVCVASIVLAVDAAIFGAPLWISAGFILVVAIMSASFKAKGT